jgi:hypothetical protein
MRLFALAALSATLAHGAVISFYSDASCTSPYGGDMPTITAYSNEYKGYDFDLRKYGLSGYFLKATTCNSASVVVTPFAGSCSTTFFIDEPSYSKKLSVPLNSCVSHENSIVQCSGCEE